MPKTHSWIVTDDEKRIYHEELSITPETLDLNTDIPWSVKKYTRRDGLADGVECIEIDNGALSFTILPTRGMGLWKGEYRGIPLGWKSPVHGPVNPRYLDLNERNGLGWLRGFDELMVRCGLESMGAPCTDTVFDNMGNESTIRLSLHGRIANTPASRVEIRITQTDPPEITVLGRTDETGLFLPHFSMLSELSTSCGSNIVRCTDTITNKRAVASDMELLYHCNFGPPILEKGSELVVAATMVTPRDSRAAEDIDRYQTYLGPTDGYVEQCYWFEPLGNESGESCALLKNASGDKAAAVRFNITELPCFTQWKNTASVDDGYVTGLEPGTSYPNPKIFERHCGRVVHLAPRETFTSSCAIQIFDRPEKIAYVEQEIETIQKQAQCTVHKKPLPSHSPL
jgi:hypothetical protein